MFPWWEASPHQVAMFSYMYELDFPKLDINDNRMGLSPSREKSIGFSTSNREKSARERSKLRRSKSTHHMLETQKRPKSHRFRRTTARDFDASYNMFPHEINIIDLEDEESVCNAAAWCVSFEEGQRPASRVSQCVRSEIRSDKWKAVMKSGSRPFLSFGFFRRFSTRIVACDKFLVV